MSENPLHQSVYSWEIKQSVFQEILWCLGYVTPQFISREQFDAEYRDNSLVSTGENKFGEEYDLFLPEDLEYIELLRIIDILNKKLDIEKYAKFDELLVKTKVAVIKFLREWGKQEEIDEYISKSWISPELKVRIEQASMMKNRWAVKEVLWEQKDWIPLEQVVADIYGQEFEKTFLRDWVNMLRLWLMTFTQNDARELDGKDGKIIERRMFTLLDSQEQKLRDTLEIDTWITELQKLRSNWDSESLARSELKFCKQFIRTLKQYPYQNSKTSYWWPVLALEDKEIQCLWFSLISHAVFTELWIKHFAVRSIWHSNLWVCIGDLTYCFDPAEFLGRKLLSSIFPWTGFVKNSFSDQEIWETEDLLFSSLYYNKWVALWELWNYTEAIEMYDRAIELDPKDSSLYNSKWVALEKLWNYTEAMEMYDRAIELDPRKDLYRKNRTIASNFLKKEWDE